MLVKEIKTIKYQFSAQLNLHVMPHEHLSCDWQVHNVLPELLESATMSWLGHVVSSHLIHWTEPYADVLLLLLISDKE